MKNLYNKIILFTLAAAFVACSTEDDIVDDWIAANTVDTSVNANSGTADLSKLVALGTSLGAGFMDGALYDDGQASSFPALLATQFQLDGIGGASSFNQPDINSANGYNFLLNDGTSGRTELSLTLLAPVPTTGDIASILTPFTGSGLNNFSVPVAQAGQLVIEATGGPVTDTYGGAVPAAANPAYNPFYGRFASNPSATGAPGSGSTPLTDALSAQGTFFIYEAGVNDVALWAAGGGTTAIGPLTDPATFEASANGAIQALALSGGAQGVVLTIPPILVFPFFQAVPYNAVPLDPASADQLNAAYATYNGGLGQALAGMLITQEEHDRRLLSFEASEGHPFVIEDETLTDLSALGIPSYRLTEPTDIIPLTTATELPTGVGTSTPAADQFVLIPSEQAAIETNRAAFNASLAGAVSFVNANGGDIVLVDIQPVFLDAAGLSDGVPGIEVQGLSLDPDFAPNGIFSTDGIHPCGRGHGIVANAIIAAINSNWGASIPEIAIESLRGPRFIP